MKNLSVLLTIGILFIWMISNLHVNATKWIVFTENVVFTPPDLPNVQLGDTIRWEWINGNHTTTSTSVPTGAATWDNPLSLNNLSFEYIPTVTGTYNYKCTPHVSFGMIGSFIVSELSVITLNMKIFLEGPFNGVGMNNDLITNGALSSTQPYNTSPWNYEGNENHSLLINAEIVDWVLVELRETIGDASTATPDKMIHRQAALIKTDGSVVQPDGSSMLQFIGNIVQNLFVVIYHRNHLSVMSAVALTAISSDYTYDFSDLLTKAYLDGQTSLSNGIFGMIGGDSNADGIVDSNDKVLYWTVEAANSGYFSSDFNLNYQVNNLDKADIWEQNIGKSSQVPIGITLSW